MHSSQSKLKVVYFSLSFPELSQTFVFNEMRSLRDRSAEIRTVAVRHSSGASNLPEKYGFANAVLYILQPGHATGRLSRILGAAKAIAGSGVGPFRAMQAFLSGKLRHTLDMPSWAALKTAAGLQPLGGGRPVIHCHFGTAGRFVASMKKLGLIDAPISVVFHGYDITQYLQGKPADTYADLFEQADILLPISDLWHGRLIELGAPREKIRTLRLGIDCNAFRFRQRVWQAGEPLRFISVGRMMEKKGHRYALEAFADLVGRRPDLDVRLDMIGSGPLFNDIRALADSFQLGSRLVLHGSLQHDEVRRLLDDAHVFVLPSVTAADGDMEGIPVAIMEAMAVGLAVISTHHSGIPELVADGKSGLLVPERYVGALSTAMETLADYPEKIVPMGIEGRRIIEESYDEEKQAERLFAALSSV